MALNYALLIMCGAYSIFGIIQMVKGTTMSRPLFTIAAIIVFILALAATLMGIGYVEIMQMINGNGINLKAKLFHLIRGN